MYRVYLFEKNDQNIINTLESDDILGRQSIIKRDGNGYGFSGKIIFILEGSETIFGRMETLSEKKAEIPTEKQSKEIYDKIKKEEEEAQGGVGFLFG